jgi:hypothetical protein
VQSALATVGDVDNIVERLKRYGLAHEAEGFIWASVTALVAEELLMA